MSNDKNFLARWSRRKRDAAPKTPEQPKPENAGGGPAAAPASVAPDDSKPRLDLASLPPIESIGAGSDIRAFLEAGVPADLTRAALRRAWSSDPQIRDFVGLSENSWDFNAPGAMPGFGPIDKEEVGRVLKRLLGEPDTKEGAAQPSPMLPQADEAREREGGSGPVTAGLIVSESAAPGPTQDQRPEEVDAANDATQRDNTVEASEHESASRENGAATPRRGHGGALPKTR